MPVIRPSDAVAHETHGSRFQSYATTETGSRQLCAWMLQVPPRLTGATHRPDREEVLLVLRGELRVVLDGQEHTLREHDVMVVNPGSDLRIDGGPDGASAWVTAVAGLRARLDDGTEFAPPWAR